MKLTAHATMLEMITDGGDQSVWRELLRKSVEWMEYGKRITIYEDKGEWEKHKEEGWA